MALLVLVGSSWWQLAVAAYWAVVFTQLGFLGHDAGHQQIFPSRRRNDLLGLLVSNLGIGLSYSWWIDKHNRHHRHPNDVDRDPDVARNVIAWTPAQAGRQRGVAEVRGPPPGRAVLPVAALRGGEPARRQCALAGGRAAPDGRSR